MTATPVPQADGETPCGYVIIGDLRIPVYNLKYTPPPRKPAMREEPTISDTEQLIRDFAAAHSLDYNTVKRLVNDGIMEQPPVTPAESLAKLAIALNGIVLHSTAAKGQSRKNIRKRDPRRKQIVGPSKKRTPQERREATDKLRAFNRRRA